MCFGEIPRSSPPPNYQCFPLPHLLPTFGCIQQRNGGRVLIRGDNRIVHLLSRKQRAFQLLIMAQNEFTRFLDASPTPYHGEFGFCPRPNFRILTAVRSSVQLLKAAGFQELQLADQWRLQRGGRYFVVK